MTDANFQTLLQFFKVMANESRLKLVGLLAQRECSVEELAALLQLKEPTVSHHLAKLKELKLVQMRSAGNTHFYRLNQDALLDLNKSLLSVEQVVAQENPIAPDAWEEKVLRSYLEGDWQRYPHQVKLREIPASRRKRRVILKWLVNQFEPETYYSEKELSDRIQRFHPDAATIRREWIGYQMMQREQSVYWRLPEAEWRSEEKA
ncbi:metalloregulator ArsR/SmtB family transcription factor [Leptolyngbya ohadii]|uniref:DUF2087 domain-containing protein n=1 Tax=Leptolyngbya ohadii TaxID=1962290 RepID=UPI000B598DA6|nr:metalloregulator ArsR/SmtB family transcription factor [Leptolyngbya ohadii]